MATLMTTTGWFCSSCNASSMFGIQEPFGQHKGKWMQTKMTSEQLGATEMQGRNCQQKAKKISVQVLLADLKACTRAQDLQRGKQVHAQAVECGHDSNIYVMSTLINMYAKCGNITDARSVFDSMPKRDVVSWSSLILGYAENGEGLVALDFFSRMKASGCAPNSVTYVAALKACTSLAVDKDGTGKTNCLGLGRQIHSEIGGSLNHYTQSALIDMYGKCGSMVDARRVFEGMQKPNVVCWNALLLGYSGNGDGLVALDLFSRMKASGCAPNSVTYIAALKACTSLAVGSAKKNCLEWGIKIHLEIGSNVNHYVQNTLIDMYAKCGSMDEARRMFDSIHKPDVVSWNALLLGYAENGQGLVAMALFSRMKAGGCAPNSVTYVAALKSCSSLAADGDGGVKANCLEWGREIHLEIGSHLDHYVQNTLIDMYSTCGSMAEAQQVFATIQKPDVVSWTALILGYVQNGEGLSALELFSSMKAKGCVPDAVTYVAALKACGSVGALALGRKLHSEITETNAHVVTCLVDFYVRCGSMVEAREVFDRHPRARNTATWNALLAGYGRFGNSDSVFNLFEAMYDEGFQPDAVTFLCLLSCCSHAGLVEKAKEYLEGMDVRYGVTPTLMHYSCMLDVLGRAKLLNEACALVQ